MDPASLNLALVEIRQRAARGDWGGVRALSDDPVVQETLEGGLLVGEAELRLGQLGPAKERLQRLLAKADQRRDPMAGLKAANMLGVALCELGDLDNALAAFESVLGAATRDGDHLMEARATSNLGSIASLRGDHETALAQYRVSVAAYQRLGLAAELSGVFHNIAIVLRDQTRYVEAEVHEQRAIEYATNGENPRVHAIARTGRADLCNRRREFAIARAEAARAARELADIGDQVSEADSLRVLALAELGLGHFAEALAHVERAVQLASSNGATLVRAEALGANAQIRMATRDLAGAADDLKVATELFAGLGAHHRAEELAAWWSQNSRRASRADGAVTGEP